MPYKNPEDAKKWKQQNKDKVAASGKKYYEKNKEKIAAYREETKQDKVAYDKKRYEENKEHILEQRKEYRQTPEGDKTQKIGMWKHRGMIAVDDNWDEVYDTYINTICCHNCCKEFTNSLDKHLDHDHATGEIRGVLCRSCNLKDVFKSNDNSAKVEDLYDDLFKEIIIQLIPGFFT